MLACDYSNLILEAWDILLSDLQGSHSFPSPLCLFLDQKFLSTRLYCLYKSLKSGFLYQEIIADIITLFDFPDDCAAFQPPFGFGRTHIRVNIFTTLHTHH